MTVGPIQFDQPLWLLLAPILWLAFWFIARHSLAGLSPTLRWTAIVVRALVVLLIAGAIAEPHWRRRAEDLAAVLVIDSSASMPGETLTRTKQWIDESLADAKPGDRLGLVTAAKEPFVQSLPSSRVRALEVTHSGDPDATDLASSIRLAMAVLPDDAARRLVLVSDGNETAGSLLAAAEAAKAANVPIDVWPVEYRIDREVALERLVAPPTARAGQTANVRFVFRTTAPANTRIPGRLTLLLNDQPVDLNGPDAGVSARIELEGGVASQVVPVMLPTGGPQRFRAVFEPDDPSLDAVATNNESLAVTFVESEGRILFLADDLIAHEPLLNALRVAGLDVVAQPTPATFESVVELSAYDAVFLAGAQSYGFSRRQQEELRAYVHDGGGGLIVTGGPSAFGAGGWIGSPLADAFPLLLDPPQKQQLPRGALALLMHSCEMPEGNFWGQKVAIAAVEALSRLDLVGVIEWDWNSGGVKWAYPMAPVGDRTDVKRAINNLVFGDMPDFNAAMIATHKALSEAQAGQKHCIIISDGDPSGPGTPLIQRFIDAGITISTVAVFPHTSGAGGPDMQKMQNIALATGGNYYFVNTRNQLANLPQIFIKEAQTVLRSLIWEGEPFTPTVINAGAIPGSPLRGLSAPPAITGYVVTADREGLALTSMRSPTDDPILAQWQHGLGRVVAYTSEASSRWNSAWLSWSQFSMFWEQQTRWAMRPTGASNLDVVTEQRGDETIVSVDALGPDGDRLNFARIFGRVVRPDLSGEPIELRMVGPGRYEGRFKSDDSGAYLLNLRYEAEITSEGGAAAVDRGIVQAAVVRSGGDERRALTSNTALLRRVADITGGRVLTGSARLDGVFDRAGLPMPVARRSMWLVFAVAGVGLFLVDVAVRRVRIDIRALPRLLRAGLARRREASEKQIDALRAARQRAKQAADERAAASSAATKFEAPKDGASGASLDIVTKDQPAPVADRRSAATKSEQPEEEGMSRLLRAKKRAQDQTRDDQPPNPSS